VAGVTRDPIVLAACHLRQALVAEAAGRYAEAKRECDLGLSLDPGEGNLRALAGRLQAPELTAPALTVQLALGRQALSEGDIGTAEAHLRRAVRLDETAREPRVRLAMLLLGEDEPREALRHFLWVWGSGSSELDRRFLEELERMARKCQDPALTAAARRRL
jgi:tetratricopeptide (TPR) repeat protein